MCFQRHFCYCTRNRKQTFHISRDGWFIKGVKVSRHAKLQLCRDEK